MDKMFYSLVKPIVKVLFYFLYRPIVIGKENVPRKGALVLAGNHTKWLDPIMLVAINKRQVHFLAKSELFQGFTKFIVKGMGCICVNRKAHDGTALSNALKYLKKSRCVGIFPEGTINRTDDVIMPFKIGAVKMSAATDSLLVPFVITGNYKLFRRGIRIEFLKGRKVTKNLEVENELLMNEVSKKLEEYNERG